MSNWRVRRYNDSRGAAASMSRGRSANWAKRLLRYLCRAGLQASGWVNYWENIIIRDEKTGLQYRCHLPGPPIPVAALEDLPILLEKGDGIRWLVVSGSMAPGMRTDIYPRLAALADRKGMRLVIDIAGEALRVALRSGVYLVKPSLHELLTLTSGRRDGTDIEDRAQQLLADSRCEAVIVSLGPDGALLATRNGCRRFPVSSSVSIVG